MWTTQIKTWGSFKNMMLTGCPVVFISQKVCLKLFCERQFAHKSVNIFFILVLIKDKLTYLWGS